MSIWRIRLSYSLNEELKKLTREAYAALREKIGDFLTLGEWTEDAATPPMCYDYNGKLLVTEREMMILQNFDITFEVVHFRHGYYVRDGSNKSSYPNTDDAAAGNHTHIHVTVNDIGLLAITEVTWEEDCCTQQLQSRLDDGWRILSVCPAYGTRRPTYILGRNGK